VFASIPVLDNEKGTSRKFEFKRLLRIFNKKSKHRKKDSGKPTNIVDPSTYSAEFEAFRKLSVNLEFAHPEEKYQVIYITSSGPDEGKTFISVNLGLVLETANKKVIAIDTDFRKKRGRVTDLVKARKKQGLFDVLKGEAQLKDVITAFTPSDISKKHTPSHSTFDSPKESRSNISYILHIVPVGKIPPNPFAFLDSNKMRDVISELRKEYDYVIIDGVPIVLFADATYLASFADGVLLAARYGKTGSRELEYAKNMLQSSRSNTIGVVMNGVPKTREGYYYYYHYYYHKYYPRYYKKEET
jgi:Mrp family chromosome partitioning ATPase